MPPSLRQYRMASTGNPPSCLRRVNRSSSANATISPSRSSAAAESWTRLMPSTYMACSSRGSGEVGSVVVGAGVVGAGIVGSGDVGSGDVGTLGGRREGDDEPAQQPGVDDERDDERQVRPGRPGPGHEQRAHDDRNGKPGERGVAGAHQDGTRRVLEEIRGVQDGEVTAGLQQAEDGEDGE